MSDIDVTAWIETYEALPLTLRERKSEVMRAALAEVGSDAERSIGGGVWVSGRPDDRRDYRAHEIGCRAIGIEPLPFDQWLVAIERLNRVSS